MATSSDVILDPFTNNKGTATKSYNLLADIEEMMYGNGDTSPSNPDSVKMLEILVIEYIQLLCANMVKVGELTNKIDKESLLFIIRKDKRKLQRVTALLKASDDMKSFQKVELADDTS